MNPLNFAAQSAIYLNQLANRRRCPVKPATLKAYNSYMTNWILPLIGDRSLETFGNGAMKRFAGQLTAGGLGPKSTVEIVTLVKQILASAVTEDGDYLYPRVWNHKFLDLPSIGEQKQPTISEEQIKLAMKDKYKVFWAFLLGTGLRIGEARAVRIGDDGASTCWVADRSVIIIRKSLWNRQEQLPKTPAGLREVDLHPTLNQLLIDASAGAKPGDYLFRNRKGGPVWLTSLAAHLKTMGIQGHNTTRRFRVSYLKKVGVPESLLKVWIGHSSGNDITAFGHSSGSDITARYDKSADDREWRQTWANKCEIGFALPEIDKTSHPKKSKVSQVSAPIAPAESPAYVAEDSDLDDFFHSTPSPQIAHEEV